MSDAPAPVSPEGPSRGSENGALTPERIEQVLADFRGWLLSIAQTDEEPEPPNESVDLHTLAGHFIALRQEVNIQTRATRASLEQNAESLRQLDELAKRTTRVAETATSSSDDQLKPLLKAIIDVYDALALARRQVERTREAIGPSLDSLLEFASLDEPPVVPESPDSASTKPGFLARLFGARARSSGHAQAALLAWRDKAADMIRARAEQTRETVRSIRQTIDSLVTGYEMGLSRIDRVLPPFGIEPIAAVGERFDPDKMEVLEVVTGTGRPEGEVIEEVRRGYLWRGTVFRYAQVRVTR